MRPSIICVAFNAVNSAQVVKAGQAWLNIPNDSGTIRRVLETKKGDVNGDGIVNVADITTIINIIGGK